MTIRIGIDYTSAIHQSAGIGRYTREMVKALARTGPTEIKYRLFAAAARGIQPVRPGPNFAWRPTYLSERWLGRLWYRLRLPWPVETWTGPLDLFHQPDFFLPPTRPGVRRLVTIHDLSFIREPETVMPGMAARLNREVPRSVQQADHVIAVSQATRQDLIELYQTPPQKISVLYHGVTGEFEPMPPAGLTGVREKYGLGEQPFILSLGTLQPRKNYGRLIQALARIDPAFSLVIVGQPGWGCDPILAEVSKLGLERRVHFPGFVADTDLPALYNAASLFVYPSLYEGFGLPALEAMACGLPVVVSNRSALPEVVGQAGLLVDPYDVEAISQAMAAVLTDPALHHHLAQAGLARAAQFTWDGMAARLLDLYHKLIEE